MTCRPKNRWPWSTSKSSQANPRWQSGLPAEERARLRAESLPRIADSQRGDQDRFLLAECVERYWTLQTPEEQRQFEELMATKEYEEAKMLGVTSFERGLQQGVEKEERNILAVVLENRFGNLSAKARERLNPLSADELESLAQRLLDAPSLAELGLED
jgi:hypothetical protein